MHLPSEIFGEVIVVHAPEEMSEDHVGNFAGYITSLERRNVVLDLDSNELLDSAGLEALIASRDALLEAGGDLKIATTIKANRKILEITRLDRHLEIFESVIDAVKSFA
jgi:anti-anti-sigma factor